MTYLSDLHTYLHQSSLLIQAYPTARITTKYSLPRKSTKSSKTSATAASTTDTSTTQTTPREKREPSALLTLKTFHPETGICLKYRTDKAQEVGRLMTGLGRLAKGEIIEPPSATAVAGTTGAGDKMDVDEAPVVEAQVPAQAPSQPAPSQQQQQQQQQSGGGGASKKKKKGKK